MHLTNTYTRELVRKEWKRGRGGGERVRNALARKRESSDAEEFVRNAGGSPLKVRSPWIMKRGVFRRGVLRLEALLRVHSERWSQSGLRKEFSGKWGLQGG